MLAFFLFVLTKLVLGPTYKKIYSSFKYHIVSGFDARTLIVGYRSNKISMSGMLLIVIELACQISDELGVR